jgi:ABC-type transport system involved in multi-copper enzyme maturation permease subunit
MIVMRRAPARLRAPGLDLPLGRVEARALARRSQAYRVRVWFGLGLLTALWFFYISSQAWSTGRPLPNRELAEFAAAAFEWLAMGQALVLLVMVPAIVGGALPEGRVRQTLPSLLASRLSSGSIVVDLLAAKLLHVLLLVAVGMPIVSLLGILGGVDPRSVVYAYAGTLSTVFFLAALALLVSVHVRRPGAAVLLVYAIEVVWLLAPWFISFVPARNPPLRALAAANRWIEPTTPLSLVNVATLSAWSKQGPVWRALPAPARPASWGGPAQLGVHVTQMVGMQLAYAVLFLIVAAWRLRPASRRLADPPRRRALSGAGRRRSRSLPPCGDNPMLWKECHVGAARPARIGLWAILALLLCFVWDMSGYFQYAYQRALDEFFVDGYPSARAYRGAYGRMDFLRALTYYASCFYGVALLAIAVGSAMAVTFEREASTWDGLLVTPLDRGQIIWAKVKGAIHRQRAILPFVVAPWLLGMVIWAVHPVGLILSVAGLFGFLWFAAALGVFCSVRSTTTASALMRTLGILLLLNVGTLFVGQLATGSQYGAAFFGNTFVLLTNLPIEPSFIYALFHGNWQVLVATAILGAYVAIHVAVSWLLGRAATRTIDGGAGGMPRGRSA